MKPQKTQNNQCVPEKKRKGEDWNCCNADSKTYFKAIITLV